MRRFQKSFGWHVIDVKDGNDIDELRRCIRMRQRRVKGTTNGTDRQYGEREKVLLLWKIKQTGIIKFRHEEELAQIIMKGLSRNCRGGVVQ